MLTYPIRLSIPLMHAVLVAALAVLLTGCAGPRPGAGASPGVLPPDFSIDLTVLSSDADAATQPVHQRPSRYVVFPDGSLHVSFDPTVATTTFPPFVRVLRRSELDALWELLQRLDLSDLDAAEPVGDLRIMSAEPGGWSTSAVIQVNGRRAWVRQRSSAPGASDSPLNRLTRALAQLAWASDEPDLKQLRIPMRYDFGPDPYARYRNNP
ncbi:MAG: hypothetical protein HRU76_16005 [Phycisphaeraceae bacterium]|nr:hypothetical protein [Phycisphaerales bacterium]QOJ18998.1 MAG: hypothetical protein HRU76_16005 [Phycisphaeraceae bacterium]